MANKQNIKNKLYFIKNVISTPALILHELLHLLFCLFTWTEVTDITIGKTGTFKKDFSYDVQIYTISSNRIKVFLISMSPFIGLFALSFIGVYFNNLYILMYTLLTYKTLIPSDEDYAAIKEFKTDEELLEEMLLDMEEE